jgi:FMN phosphatase YigB (HAD superfamily)
VIAFSARPPGEESFPGLRDDTGAVIFDLDGTLYDSKNIAFRLIMARPLDVFFMRTERRVRKVFAGRVYDSAESYYRAFFQELSEQARCTAAFARHWYFETYMPLMIRVLGRYYRPRPGAAELLAALRSGNNRWNRVIPFAVYSDYPMTGERLKALGLDVHGKVYGPEDFGAQKPAAVPFLRIARDLGSPPGDTLVAGDRDDTDGVGARAAGMEYLNVSAASWGPFCSLLMSH